jgi:hypothetical protein
MHQEIFQQVNVDVLRVDIHYEKLGVGDDRWWSPPTEPGIYDLLKLQNDGTVVLTNQGKIPVGKVTQMRLILGGVLVSWWIVLCINWIPQVLKIQVLNLILKLRF